MDKVEPKYLDRDKKSWRKAEEDVAKVLKGKRQKKSGAMEGFKGDVDTEKFLVEVKSTDGHVIMLDYKWLLKIDVEARGVNKMPMLVVSFNNAKVLDKWVCIPLNDWKNIT